MRRMSHSATRMNRLVLLLALACLLLVISATQTTHARDDVRAPAEPASPTDDGGTAEIGVEWITDWPGTADDRANWYYSANDLYNKMRDAGWIGRFNWGQTNAWERDFKHSMYGGINDSVVDAVDLAMMATHGSSAWDTTQTPDRVLSSVYFSSNNDDWHLSPGEARRAYGNNDLEWLIFDSCSVLRDDSMWYWHETFDGLHLMAGFANTMYVVYRGDGGAFANELLKTGWWIFGHPAKTVTQAWFTGTDDEQPNGVRARVLAEELNSYNDYVWGQGYVSPDYPNDGDYWYWDHVAGTPDPLPLAGQAPAQLPIVQVVQREVDENYVMMIGEAFGLTGEVLTSPDGRFMYMAGGPDDAWQLRVDVPSGGFLFQNLDELWTDPERARDLPDARQVRLAADDFIAQHEGLPGAFWYNPDILPTVVQEGPAVGFTERYTGTRSTATSAISNPTNYAVHYAKTVFGPEGDYAVVGPGARQNIYIGDGGEVVGFKGGWRTFDVTNTMIQIINDEQAWAAFMENPGISLAQLPAFDVADLTGKPAPTLAYYEVSLSEHQTQLIPVWLFIADLFVETPAMNGMAAPAELVPLAQDAYIYIPAEADTPMPTATITSPADGLTLGYGGTVDLVGSASGGSPPYTYLWSSNYDGDLGTSPTINDVTLHAVFHGGLAPNTITLTVVDDNGISASDSVEVFVDAPLFLPIIAGD